MSLSALWVVGLALVAFNSEAQTNASPTRISSENAIAVASQLTLGMKETDAIQFLASHGINGPGKLGCSHGWTFFYSLSDSNRLGLDIGLTRADPHGSWDNVLRAAYIQRNGTNFAVALRSPLINTSGESQPVLLLFACLIGLAAALVALARRAGADSETANRFG